MKTLSERLEGILRECPFVKGYKLAVDFENPQKLILTGRVRSYFAKQMAQETVVRFLRENPHQVDFLNEVVVET